MKTHLLKVLPLFACLLLFTQTAFGVIAIKPIDNITKIGNTDFSERNLSIDDMLHLDNKAIGKKTGKKLKLKEKLALRIARKKIKKARKKGKNDAEIKTLLAEPKGGSKSNAFLLGLAIGFIGVIISYTIMEGQYAKYSWLGFIGFIILFYLFIKYIQSVVD